jgi:RNA polymerase sigma-70 factor (ECF subfamily)
MTIDTTTLKRLQAQEEKLRALFVNGLNGHDRDYEMFLTQAGAHIRAFLRRKLASLPNDVEDLVQETLLAIHNQRHTYQPERPLTAWMHAIARYKMIDFLRHRSGHDALNDSIDEMPDQFLVDSDTNAVDAQRDVTQLLDQLPDQQRLPLIHTKLHGLSVKEAALKTGMSESAIKVGVHRGLKALAALMQSVAPKNEGV